MDWLNIALPNAALQIFEKLFRPKNVKIVETHEYAKVTLAEDSVEFPISYFS